MQTRKRKRCTLLGVPTNYHSGDSIMHTCYYAICCRLYNVHSLPPWAAALNLTRLGHALEAAVRQQVYCQEVFPLALNGSRRVALAGRDMVMHVYDRADQVRWGVINTAIS